MQGYAPMWLGFAAAIVLAVIAGFALSEIDKTADQRYSTENVRLR